MNGMENYIVIVMWVLNEGGVKLLWLILKSGYLVRLMRIWLGDMNLFVVESYYDGREGLY